MKTLDPMHHPVFLTNSNLGHMPIGSQNQWSLFYHSATFELQADNFVPFLWLMLFEKNDLYWAKYTDLLDTDEPNLQNALLEYQHDFGEQEYAYLVTDQQQALKNLEHNSAFFIHSFGEENLSYYEHFKQMIEQYYPNYILLRSSGLDTELNQVDHLSFPLQQLYYFQQDPSQENALSAYQKVALSQFDDYAYCFYGIDPTTMALDAQNNAESDLESNHEMLSEQALQPTDSTSGTAVWMCTAIVSILTLVVWFNSHSILYAFLAFIVSAFVLGFVSSRIAGRK